MMTRTVSLGALLLVGFALCSGCAPSVPQVTKELASPEALQGLASEESPSSADTAGRRPGWIRRLLWRFTRPSLPALATALEHPQSEQQDEAGSVCQTPFHRPGQDLLKKLDRIQLKLGLNSAPLQQALTLLEEGLGVPIVLACDAEAEARGVTVEAMGGTGTQVLNEVLAACDMCWVAEEGRIVVVERGARGGENVWDFLLTPLKVVWQEVPLEQAIESLGLLTGLRFDREALPDCRGQAGIGSEERVTLDLPRASVLEVLQRLCAEARLEWKVEGDGAIQLAEYVPEEREEPAPESP